MKLHLWISEEHLSVLSYGTPFLIRKSFQGLKTLFWWNSAGTVISWRVWSLISLEVLWRLAGLSVTLGFSSQTRKKAFPNFLLEYYQRKKMSNQKVRCARTRHCYAMPILLCFSDVFLHFKNVFISHVWEVNNCTAWVKPLFWNRSETIWNFIKTLRGKTAETQETHDVVLTL